jgi:hypothetical protein
VFKVGDKVTPKESKGGYFEIGDILEVRKERDRGNGVQMLLVWNERNKKKERWYASRFKLANCNMSIINGVDDDV